MLLSSFIDNAACVCCVETWLSMDCRAQIIADRGYSATQPFPIQLVLAGRKCRYNRRGRCVRNRQIRHMYRNPPIQYIRVKGQVYKRHTNVSDARIHLPFQGGRSHSPCHVVVTYSHASRSHWTILIYLQPILYHRTWFAPTLRIGFRPPFISKQLTHTLLVGAGIESGGDTELLYSLTS